MVPIESLKTAMCLRREHRLNLGSRLGVTVKDHSYLMMTMRSAEQI